MEEITQKQLAICSYSHMIHVDNFQDDVASGDGWITYCGVNSQKSKSTYDFLVKDHNDHFGINICKKCSKFYRIKYKHSLEGFIARLKIRDKLYARR